MAIALGEEGLRLLDRGEHAAALRKFEAANDLVPAPTFGVRAALCLEYLGRLVEALDRYERVAAMQIDPSWPDVHREAQQKAQNRTADLRRRVARLYIALHGDHPEQAILEIDGRRRPYAGASSAILLDPGTHTVEVTYGDHIQRREFQVRESVQHREAFRLPMNTDTNGAAKDSAQRTAGWVGVGLGVAGIAVGSISGIVAWDKSNDLESRCPDRVCPSEAWDDNDSYHRWRNVSTMGFSVGTITLGTGVLLLLTSPSEGQERDTAKVEPWVGLGSAGVRGGF